MAGAPSGAPAAPANGGWYGGQMFYNGQWGNPGQDLMHGGGTVSAAVAAQTNPNNVAYLQGKGAQLGSSGGGTDQSDGGTGLGSFGGNQPAVPDLKATYDQYYTNNPDVLASHAKIADLQGQLTTRQQALDTATKNINDNPFYAEATRVGKVAQLNNEAQNDMNTLTGQLNTEQASIANAQAEAERQVNLSQGQYTLNNQAWQQNLQEFNTLLSAGALENATPQDLAGLSVSTGIPTSMLNGIQSAQNAKNTQVVTSTDNSGNVTISAVDSRTGKIINQTSLGAVGAAKTGKSGSGKVTTADGLSAMTPKVLSQLNSYGNISPGSWNSEQAAWLAAGLPKADFVANYGQYADTNRGDFLSAYGFANPKTAATVKSNQAVNTKPVN